MGHSIGDGIIVAALAAAFIGYRYLRFLEERRRLELLHAERLTAMEKGVPLLEIPLDPPHPPISGRVPEEHIPFLLGVVLSAFGFGTMIALRLVFEDRVLWPLPLPIGLIGLGLVWYATLVGQRAERDNAVRSGE
jgi:hypothetical protein